MWRDVVLAVGGVFLTLYLVPVVFSNNKKPPVSTALVYGIVLGSYGMVYCSFGAYFAAGTVWMQSLLWFVVTGQVIWNERRGLRGKRPERQLPEAGA